MTRNKKTIYGQRTIVIMNSSELTLFAFIVEAMVVAEFPIVLDSAIQQLSSQKNKSAEFQLALNVIMEITSRLDFSVDRFHHVTNLAAEAKKLSDKRRCRASQSVGETLNWALTNWKSCRKNREFRHNKEINHNG